MYKRQAHHRRDSKPMVRKIGSIREVSDSGRAPGSYAVVAWHKSAGFFRKLIFGEAGHDSIADFFIPISEDAEEKSQ